MSGSSIADDASCEAESFGMTRGSEVRLTSWVFGDAEGMQRPWGSFGSRYVLHWLHCLTSIFAKSSSDALCLKWQRFRCALREKLFVGLPQAQNKHLIPDLHIPSSCSSFFNQNFSQLLHTVTPACSHVFASIWSDL